MLVADAPVVIANYILCVARLEISLNDMISLATSKLSLAIYMRNNILKQNACINLKSV